MTNLRTMPMTELLSLKAGLQKCIEDSERDKHGEMREACLRTYNDLLESVRVEIAERIGK